jgi:two-component system, NtrC family, response regulator AtoC
MLRAKVHVMQSRLDALIATPDAGSRSALIELVGRCGWLASAAVDGEEAAHLLERQFFDLLILCESLARTHRWELLRRLREHSPETSLVLLAAKAAPLPAEAEVEVDGYLTVPVDAHEASALLERIARDKEQQTVERRWDELADAEVYLAGSSEAMRDVVQQLDLVARAGAAVLLTGEAGLGQEAIARALHGKSARAAMPFVAVDCARIQTELLDEELFGRSQAEGGTRAPSAVERAHRGSLFVESIDAAPLAVQRKLLRLLDDGVVHPAGTARRIKVDVRVIAAGPAQLKQLVAEGRVLPDLYYRMSSMEIALPSLRKRKGDLRALVDCVLERLSGPEGTRQLSAAAWSALNGYEFPDNIRELVAALVRGVLLAGEDEIGIQHLPPNVRTPSRESAADEAPLALGSLDDAARNFEREFLVRVLASAGGNRTRAAQLLGLSRKGLWQKLRAHGIPASEGRGAAEKPADAKGIIRGPWPKSGSS